MLSVEENEILTRIGPGTPMGDLYRRFWHPVLLAEELPVPDCPPVRLQVLGEELVAFKDTDGRIGVLDRRCPHRLADLFWGRNENGGLRCVLRTAPAPERDLFRDPNSHVVGWLAGSRGDRRGGTRTQHADSDATGRKLDRERTGERCRANLSERHLEAANRAGSDLS